MRTSLNSTFAVLLAFAATSPVARGARIQNGSISVDRSAHKSTYVPLARITLEDAIQRARKQVPGTAIEADLEREDGFLVYGVKVMTSDQRIAELKIDAGNGNVLDQTTRDRYAE